MLWLKLIHVSKSGPSKHIYQNIEILNSSTNRPYYIEPKYIGVETLLLRRCLNYAPWGLGLDHVPEIEF